MKKMSLMKSKMFVAYAKKNLILMKFIKINLVLMKMIKMNLVMMKMIKMNLVLMKIIKMYLNHTIKSEIIAITLENLEKLHIIFVIQNKKHPKKFLWYFIMILHIIITS